MHSHLRLYCLRFAVLIMTFLPFSARASVDPILATPERLLRIHQGLMAGEPHFEKAFAVLIAELEEQGDPHWRVEGDNWSYARSYKAQKEAFLFALTGEPYWADRAYQTLRSIYDDPDPDGRFAERGNSGLSRATVGLGFALAYNWCGQAWDEEKRAWVREILEKSLARWKEFHHHNFGALRKSNWVAVCRGVELMQILALGEREIRRERYEYLLGELWQHVWNGYDRIGASLEGIGYTSYGVVYLLPAVIAAADLGDERLSFLIERERHWHEQLMYSGAFGLVPGQEDAVLRGKRVFTFSGVGGPNSNDHGWASLVLATTPPEALPEYLWWYDRHIGHLSVEFGAEEQSLFDPARHGRIWAMLFYPRGIEARDPQGSSPRLVNGEQGRNFFRNRWQDQNDILIAFHQHLNWGPRAWNQSEAGALSIFAYDTFFLTGPRTNREPERYNRVLVNGSRGRSNPPGRFLYRRVWEDRGYYSMGVDASDTFHRWDEEREVELYERHVLVGLGSPEDNDAIVVTLDRVRTKNEATFTWNGYTGLEERLGGWAMDRELEEVGDWPAFLLRGHNSGGILQGVLLAPQNAGWVFQGESVQAEVTGDETEYLVVLALHPGTPPEVEKLEAGEDWQDYRVGSFHFRWDRKNNRLRPLPEEAE